MVSSTCWRRFTLSEAISLLRRTNCSLSSRLYRMLPCAGCGAGFLSVVMMKPVINALALITPSSRREPVPSAEFSIASVPAPAIPV